MTGQEKERLRQVEALFDQALEFSVGPERETWLQGRGADPGILAALRLLLDGHELLGQRAPANREELPRFGPWQATRLLGRGGMGVVYLAERADGAFQMNAAVKVVPLALASVEIEERFRRERQFLASLEHSGIARLIDGGTTATGLPFLVMEFVDGPDIARYCESQHLDERGRITLMRQVLEALAYVHSRQVVHSDLKPSNILVDPSGVPKLLDFGLARLVDASGEANITRNGIFAFTPEYASPEQRAGKPVTYASDIYSAGAVLYRLLTRRAARQTAASGAEVPPPESGSSGTDASVLDVPMEAILSKALETAPERRYASVAEMDAELERYLAGEPVLASVPAGSTQPHRKRFSVAARSAIVLGALIVLGLLGLPMRRAWIGRTASQASIAVLPFRNLSADPANQYFADGLTNEVTDLLARNRMLRVIAPTSVSLISGKATGAADAGRKLGVASILEGSVERSGGRIKIIVLLARTSDGSHLWSNTYERLASDLFEVQSELAAAIAGSLNVSSGLLSAVPPHIPTPEANDWLMKGRYELHQNTVQSVARAEEHFRRAIDADPAYAPSYMALGAAVTNKAVARFGNRTTAERAEIERLARKAMELDPSLSGPHAALAAQAMQYDWDWKRAEAEYQKATSSTPDPVAETGYALLLTDRGRFAEANPHIKRALDLDPFGFATLNNVSNIFYLQGRTQEWREVQQKLLSVTPKGLSAQLMNLASYVDQGHPDWAWPEFQKLEQQFPAVAISESWARARMGQKEEALRLLRPFEEKYPNQGVAVQGFALVYGILGDESNALKWLERSADAREFQVTNVAVNPAFRSMENSPGFHALKRRMGLE